MQGFQARVGNNLGDDRCVLAGPELITASANSGLNILYCMRAACIFKRRLDPGTATMPLSFACQEGS